MAEWKEPKTDWVQTDKFNIDDYNRVKNNLKYLHEYAVKLYPYFDIGDMGSDVTSYGVFWDVNKFNLFEDNLETINNNVSTQDIGTTQHFYENGVFIKYDELNRIENATLMIKNLLDGQAGSRLAFRLGQYRALKI